MISCQKLDCLLAQSGVCLDGISPPDDCPNSIYDGAVLDKAEDEPVDPEVTLDKLVEEKVDSVQVQRQTQRHGRSIGPGLELTETRAVRIAKAKKARLVVLVGLQECGKTTILAELFESFMDGQIKNVSFAGSETLVAFETRCHNSRNASGNSTPHTPRTPGSALDTPFLHLDVHNEESLITLLLADISGETYFKASSSSTTVEKLDFLKRADFIIVMLDGAKLAESASRETEKTTIMRLLQRFIDSKMIQPKCEVQAVVTKWDSLVHKGSKKDNEAYVKDVFELMSQKFSGSVSSINFFRTAARPKSENTEKRFGLADLFTSWCASDPPLENIRAKDFKANGQRQISAHPGGL